MELGFLPRISNKRIVFVVNEIISHSHHRNQEISYEGKRRCEGIDGSKGSLEESTQTLEGKSKTLKSSSNLIVSISSV